MLKELRPIKSDANYRTALKRVEENFDAKRGTRESDELEILGLLVDYYENKHFPIEAPDQIEQISS